eukprot:214344-Pleurochrysis_carterae.AAC.2
MQETMNWNPGHGCRPRICTRSRRRAAVGVAGEEMRLCRGRLRPGQGHRACTRRRRDANALARGEFGMQAHRSRADEKRPDVERAARAVWRHILCVRLHRPVHRLQKHGLRHGRHHQTRRAHIHAVTILWDVAHADHPIFCSERFAALK